MEQWFLVFAAMLVAVVGFPILVLAVHGWRERRHNRRMGRRRTDKHRLL